MKNVKIGTKLVLSFLFVAVLTAVIGIHLLYSLDTLDGETDLLYEKGAVPLGMLVKTGEQAQELRTDIRRWQLAKTNEGRATLLKAIDETNNLMKELISKQKELVFSEAGKKFLDDLQDAADKYVAEVHNYTKTAKIDPVTGLCLEELSPAVLSAANAMSKALDIAVERRVNLTKELSDEASKRTHHDKKIAIILLIAVLLISISSGVFLTLSITRPLHTVVSALSKIEKGDMTIRAGLVRGDELGTLSKALDSLSSRLQTIFKNLRQDSDTLANEAEELSTIGRESSETAEKNMSSSVTIASEAEEASVNVNAMASGAEEASVNANEVAGAAEQMSTNMNTIAAAVEEMSASIKQISSNAGEANKVANEATIKSNNATGVMNKLGAAAKEIGQVTDVIKKIADKTNLLALNATIEAASAGEAGKGFAVVAGEIKELANQSAKSADDIAQRIEGIQVGTGEAVTVINDVSDIIVKINKSVESISGHVSQQTKASNEISSNVTQANIGAKRVASSIAEVAKGSKDIARNAGEAARGINVMSQNVAGVAQNAKDSAREAKEINQNSNELAKLAGDLKSILSQFKV
ncbi:methyl-accepting chemotaxis protein [Fibrobacteria bacterium R8-3-H12]